MMQTRERRRLWLCHLNKGCVGSTESIVTKIARTCEMCSIRIHLRWSDAEITRMSCAQKLSTRTAMYGNANGTMIEYVKRITLITGKTSKLVRRDTKIPALTASKSGSIFIV